MDTKALRQKILDLAIRGKLVPQDPNDEPAAVLLEKIREEKQRMLKAGEIKAKDIKNDTVIFKGDDNLHYEKFQDGTVKCIEEEIPFEVPEGWAWTRIGTAFFTVTGSTPPTKDASLYGIEFSFYKPTDLDAGFDVYSSEAFVSEKGYLSGRILPEDSVLVTCIGATIGKTGYIRNTGICNQQINAIIPNKEMLPEYTYFCMCSEYEQQQIKMNSSATTLPILNKGKFDNLLIPIPPQHQQALILTNVKNLLSLITVVQNERAALQTIVSSIKSKILDLAIRGKLVQQDTDDEPASVLLERIRAEKEELIKTGKIKRDKKESIIFKGGDNSYYVGAEENEEYVSTAFSFAIPKNWCWARLESLCAINPRNNLLDDEVVSFVPMPLIEDGFSGIHTSERKLWREIKRGFTHFQDGDIGIAKITPCFENRKSVVFYNLIGGYGAGTTELHILRPYSKEIVPEYLLALLKGNRFINLGKQAFTGAVGQQRIGKDYVSNTYCPLPPVAEQKRIAENIKFYFEQLDKISAALA